jgi:hypothetical protein
MPPRHVYWTIILEGKPTAFRAHTRDELAPTLRQLQSRHPDAVVMWFARGRLWASPEDERAARSRKREGERRGPEWRPGGTHRDPRDRFNVPRDEKRRRFAERLRRDRFDGDRRDGAPPRDDKRERPQKPFDPSSDRRPRGPGRERKPFRPSGERRPTGSFGNQRSRSPRGERGRGFRPGGSSAGSRGGSGRGPGGPRKPGGGRKGGGGRGGGRGGSSR